MEPEEYPQKRRKLSPSNTPPPISQEDNGTQYETVATLPLHSLDPLSQTPQTQYLTQPTQIVGQPSTRDHIASPEQRKSIVQVAASSPLALSLPKGGYLASALAPAGTAFRPPGVNTMRPMSKSTPKPSAIDLSSDAEDDGPRYLGGSSDEEDTPVRNGNSSSLGLQKQADRERVEDSPSKNGLSKIQEVTKKAVYDPNASKLNLSSLKGSVFDSRNRNEDLGHSTIITPSTKKSSDVMANAYGNISRRTQAERHQFNNPQTKTTSPSNSNFKDISVDDIMDPQHRVKVKRIQGVFPHIAVKRCYEALRKKKGHFEDTIDYLSSESDKRVDLTVSSEDELQGLTPMVPRQKPAMSAKPVPKAPIKTIREKYSGTAESTIPKPSIAEKYGTQLTGHNPVKLRKRLIQGRKHASSPAVESPKKEAAPVEPSDSEASDPGLSDIGNATFDGRLLKFFNTCSASDLTDTASIDNEVAEYIIQKRPFTSLERIRKIPPKNAAATAKKSRARPIGEKVVDKCEDMFVGYEAVDVLVKKCESLGKPLSEEMKNWGVDVFGSTSTLGELDFTHFGGFQHDSGIGTPTSDTDDELAKLVRHGSLLPQPVLMKEGTKMKDYQLVGFNWLNLLYRQKLSCLLSDDMGLGKTCQVIAFLAHLHSTGERGPHLVVVPSSTLENWLLEFKKFCPRLKVEPLHGSQKERFEIRDMMEQIREDIDVMITTYTMATSKDDYPFLKKYGFNCVIFDEGHMLKNSKSQQYTKLIRIHSQFRLLLTGTPVQNNLQELASLLGFVLPDIFHEKKHDLTAIFEHKVKTNSSNHEALLSKQRIDRARSMLTPFILRRQKHQVLKDLPSKTSRVEYCDLTDTQKEIYETEIARVRELWDNRNAGIKDNKSANILMKLRQAALHPMLFRRHYTDSMLPKIAKACLKDPQFEQSSPDLIQIEIKEYSDLELYELCEPRPALSKFVLDNNMWMDSGKVNKLVELLYKFKEQGSRTLIFSQFRMILNILEMVLNTIEMSFLRIDGETDINARQSLIDQFYTNEDIPVFMLTTKAGGAGINLAAANKIIIFDSSFNPQDDIQAENRAHRIGQTKEVEVVRLIGRETVEEQIFAMGRTKLALDQKVVGAGESGTAMDDSGNTKVGQDGEQGVKKMEEMILDKLKEGVA